MTGGRSSIKYLKRLSAEELIEIINIISTDFPDFIERIKVSVVRVNSSGDENDGLGDELISFKKLVEENTRFSDTVYDTIPAFTEIVMTVLEKIHQ